MVNDNEYDLYMRVDSNTRGHHQWFYFKVTGKIKEDRQIKFNIVNFTKKRSLYENGMKVCICDWKERTQQLHALIEKRSKGLVSQKEFEVVDFEALGWKRGGDNITYQKSKINPKKSAYVYEESEDEEDDDDSCEEVYKRKLYYQLSFTHEFKADKDSQCSYFAYSFPYTFTKVCSLMKQIRIKEGVKYFMKENPTFVRSLSGVFIPLLTITSRVDSSNKHAILHREFAPEDLPKYSFKRTVIITGRVHPGETNASYMMQGFL